MKIQFISYDSIDEIKTNLSAWSNNFCKDSSEWLIDEFEGKLFLDTKYGEIPDITLELSEKDQFSKEAVNAQRVYEGLKFLSDSQASDERLWAGLCLGPFWKYVQTRWNICKNPTPSNILQHYFFGFGARRSLTRNAISRLWWIGRLTYDENREDHYELTKLVCENANYIVDALERNTSNNPMIVRAFLDAVLEARKAGIKIDKESFAEMSKYLNLLGGTYILDCLPAERITNKILSKVKEVANII